MVKPILSPRAVLSSIPSPFSRSTSKISTLQAWFTATRQLQQQRCCHSVGAARGGLRIGRDEGRIGSRIGNGERVGTRTWGWGQQQRRNYKTIGEQKARYKSGPFSYTAGLLFLASGVGLVFYFRYEKERMERKRIAEAAKGVGKPKVGGVFELVDQFGKGFTSEDMKGRYSLVYFGFTHCPDICPEELDKMARIIDLVNAATQPSSSALSQSLQSNPSLPPSVEPSTSLPDISSKNNLPSLLPLFITCDPSRDTPSVIGTYLSEFHPSIIGLTGTWAQIKDVCKKYRVYFSTPEGVKPGQDYLVDHSIYFYLMDPEGDFVEAIGRQHSPEEAARLVLGHWGDWVRERERK